MLKHTLHNPPRKLTHHKKPSRHHAISTRQITTTHSLTADATNIPVDSLTQSNITASAPKKAKKPSKNRYKKFVTNPDRQILSGIQPTGVIHIGNLFGAISNWVSLQYTEPLLKQQNMLEDLMAQRQSVKNGELSALTFKPQPHKPVLYTVVDLHAITIPKTAEGLDESIRTLTATLLGCGIDPTHSNLFIQSHVREHTELAWLLTCNTPVSWLYRMTQFKDKSSKLEKAENNESTVNGETQDELPLSQLPRGVMAGLLQYPALMAADILLYNATHVPVGDDQTQHLEFTRELARTMNSQYSPIFVEPQAVHNPYATRVMSLRSPEMKMSKSDPSAQGKITLQDTDAEIMNKINRAMTDSVGGVTYDPQRPGLSNLLEIYAATENMKYLSNFHKTTGNLLENNFFVQNGMFPSFNNDGNANFEQNTHKLLKFATETLTTAPGAEDEFEKQCAQWLNIVNRPQSLVSPKDLAEKHKTDLLSTFKPTVGASLVSLLAPIREKTNEVLKDQIYMAEVVQKGADTARGVAQQTVARTKDVMGMRF